VTHDSASTKVGLDIDIMNRHQIDDVLEGLAFATWVSHTHIIVKNADDVKLRSRSMAPAFSAVNSSIHTTSSVGPVEALQKRG